jgi:hypothetical protein
MNTNLTVNISVSIDVSQPLHNIGNMDVTLPG